MSDRIILMIQVAGFVTALAFLPFFRGWMQLAFAAAFAVHFVGDLLRLHKDGVI